MAFDIVKQNWSSSAEQGYSFDLLAPDGSETGAKLTILGNLSPTVENHTRRSLAEMARKEKVAKGKNKDYNYFTDPEDYEEMMLSNALVRLIGWSGIEENGKAVPFSKEKAAEFLKIHKWAREQISEQSAEVSNFTPKTSKG